MKKQEEIFNEFKNLALEIQRLSGYVQNDLGRMIKDNDVLDDFLKENKIAFINDVQKFADNLYNVCKDVAEIYDYNINNYNTIKEIQ